MGRIKLTLIITLFTTGLLAQESGGRKGLQAVFFQLEPEFMSLNIDAQVIGIGKHAVHARTGFMANLANWMGVPLELNYLIPVGNEKNHVVVGGAGAYTWLNADVPRELWGGPMIGYRYQPQKLGLFVRAGILLSFERYWTPSEVNRNTTFRPSFGVGLTF